MDNQRDSSLLSYQIKCSGILTKSLCQNSGAFYLVTLLVNDYIHKNFDSLLKLLLKPIGNYQWLKEGGFINRFLVFSSYKILWLLNNLLF